MSAGFASRQRTANMFFAPALGSRKYGREVVAHHMLSIDTHATSAQRNHSGRCYHELT